MKYAVILERTPNNYGASIPDLPGCVAAADTREETLDLIREGIGYHIELTMEYGDPVPEPRMSLADAMADYLAMDEGYVDPETGEFVKYDSQETEVAFLMVEVDVETPKSALAAVAGIGRA